MENKENELVMRTARISKYLILISLLGACVHPGSKLILTPTVYNKECLKDSYYKIPCRYADTTTPNHLTKVCSLTPSGWAYQVNAYYLSDDYTKASILPRTHEPYLSQTCYSPQVKNIVKGEYLIRKGRPQTYTTLSRPTVTLTGDLCDDSEASINFYHIGRWSKRNLPQYLHLRPNLEWSNEHPMFDADKVVELYDIGNPLGFFQQMLFAIAEISIKQCGKPAKKLTLSGRYIEELEIAHHQIVSHKRGKYEFIEFFTGTLEGKEFTIGASNQEFSNNEESWKEAIIAEQRRRLDCIWWRRYARKHNAAYALGALLFRGGLGIIWGESFDTQPDEKEGCRGVY